MHCYLRKSSKKDKIIAKFTSTFENFTNIKYVLSLRTDSPV